MLCFPNAKINIGLNIIRKRRDGYHDIESVLYPVGLTDVLEFIEDPSVVPEDSPAFTNSGYHIPGGVEKNLCVQAYYLLRTMKPLPGIRIHLHKNIPVGSGLGGGSSDGAFMIRMLNDTFGLNLSLSRMLKSAEFLGSDCPFFILNKTGYAQEKGNKLTTLKVNLQGYILIIVYPGIEINTGEIYRKVKPCIPVVSLADNIHLPPEEWKDRIKNDFEEVIFSDHPGIADIKKRLYDSGAVYSSLSGSGSTVYGIFTGEVDPGMLFPDKLVWKILL